MDAYLEWDDRGRTYALWRHARSWPEELAREWVGYRLDFVIEADPEPLKKATRANTGLDSSALMRRADRHFPPRVETVFIDVDGSPPPDSLQRLLHKEPKKKEEGGQDTNLTQEHEGVLHHFVGKMQWENKCQEARSEAEAMLRTSADFQDRTALGREDARRTLRERLERLRARTNSSLSTDRSSSLNERVALERQIGKALIESIETPSVRLESIGFLVASTRSLREFLQAQSEKRDQPDPDGR
jgi:ATP-dependent helicase HepA